MILSAVLFLGFLVFNSIFLDLSFICQFCLSSWLPFSKDRERERKSGHCWRPKKQQVFPASSQILEIFVVSNLCQISNSSLGNRSDCLTDYDLFWLSSCTVFKVTTFSILSLLLSFNLSFSRTLHPLFDKGIDFWYNA